MIANVWHAAEQSGRAMCYGDFEIGTGAGHGTLTRQAGDDIAEWADIAVGAPNDYRASGLVHGHG